MGDEARKLLDEQIAAINALRTQATFAYMRCALISTYSREFDAERFASFLSQFVDHLAKLRSSLRRAQHWLGATTPVQVPLPGLIDSYSSACAGSEALLLMVIILAANEVNLPEPLPADSDSLRIQLIEKFRRDGCPSWVETVPVAELQILADLVERETDTAIAMRTREFREADNGSEVALSEPLYVTLKQIVEIIDERVTKRTIQNEISKSGVVLRNKRKRGTAWAYEYTELTEWLKSRWPDLINIIPPVNKARVLIRNA